jgi:anti-sigma factor RsiW
MDKETGGTGRGAHINEAQLMMYADGELPPAEAELLLAHLCLCPECQRSFDDLQEASRAYLDFQEQWSGSLPPPPLHWMDFESKLWEILAPRETSPEPVPKPVPEPVVDRRPWGGGLLAALRKISVALGKFKDSAVLPWALSGAAAALALAFLFLHLPAREPLSVDQVLTRVEQQSAGQEAAASQVFYQKIRITDSAAPLAPVIVQVWNDPRHGRFREEAGNGAPADQASAAPGRAASDEQPGLLRDLHAAFDASHLLWKTPVSGEAFKQWTRAPGRKEESLSEERLSGGEQAYRLSAKVADASFVPASATPFIRSMDLLVRATDWHIIAERLCVTNQNRTHTYEIVELEYREIPLSQLPENIFGAQAGGSAPVSDAGAVMPQHLRASSLADLTVEALSRLDRTDALAQDQIAVTPMGSEGLRISGTVRSEARRAEIVDALGSLAGNPAVKLRLLTAAEARAVGAAPLAHPMQVQSVEVLLNESGALSEVRAYLSAHRHIPEHDLDQAADRFITDAVDHSSEAQLHAQALKQIAGIAPLFDSGQVSPATGEKWRALVARHAQSSRQEIRWLEQQLAPVFSHAAATEPAPADGMAGESDPRPAASRLLSLATDSDRILWQVFSSNASPADRRGLTDARFWLMLREEDLLAAHLAEKVHP